MNILVTGDSHTGAIRRGLDLLQERNELPQDLVIEVKPLCGGNVLPTPFFMDEGHRARMTDETVRRNFAVLPPDDARPDWIGFCAPLHSARVYRGKDWAHYATAAMPPAAIPLSAAAFRRVVLDDQKYVLKLLEVLVRNGQRVFAIEPPRPFRHHYRARQLGIEKLLQIDSAYRHIMGDELARLRVPVIGAPEESIDSDGCTREEFQSAVEGDQHHANAAFGALVIRRFERLAALDN